MSDRSKKWFWLFVLLFFVGSALGSVFYSQPIWTIDHIRRIGFRLSGVESRWVTLDGYRIHYYVRGPANGPAIVLVHGLGARAEDWMELAPWLVRAGFRVYMPDLLGYGQSQKPSDAAYSIPEEAGVVVSFMDAMQLRQPDLAGWSMGGWIAQRIAWEHPDRVRRLVLMDSAGLKALPDWDTRLFTPTSHAELDQLDALIMPHPPNVPEFIAQDIVRLSEKNGWVIKRALVQMLSGRDVTDAELPALTMPVLILWADQDHIMPLSLGQTMHRLVPQSRLEIAPGCGHLAPEQCPAQYGPALVRFLQADPALGAGEEVLQ